MDSWLSQFSLDLSIHGWIALGLCVVGVIGLNAVLLHLARKPWQEFRRDRDRPGPPDAA